MIKIRFEIPCSLQAQRVPVRKPTTDESAAVKAPAGNLAHSFSIK